MHSTDRPARRTLPRSVLATAIIFGAQASVTFAQDGHDAPSSYYQPITTQTGATLKTDLRTIISTGVRSYNYGDSRYILNDLWRDPNNASKVILIYTGASVNGAWDSGVTWNREHQWPDSKLGVNTSNSTTGPAADLFELAPCNPSLNSSRGNNNFGGYNSSGSAGNSGSIFFPGDLHKGDAARSIFYMATRYSNLTVTNGSPSATYQFGDLASMVKWHYADAPDTFERRKNHVNYTTYQRNRNPFIDRPEYVHSVFVDQANDTRLTITGADSTDANAGSTKTVNLGRVLRGAAVPGTQNVTLGKVGADGTYYSVTANGAATSSVNGRLNTFGVDVAGNRSIAVGLNTTTTAVGLKNGSVTIDNLDVTTQGGAGRGANDANDVINLQLSVLDVSNPSFLTGSDTNTLQLSFGDVALGADAAPLAFSVSNFASSFGTALTAGLDFDSMTASGNAALFNTNLATFSNLAAGTNRAFAVDFATDAVGSYAATYTLRFSDEDLPGTRSTSTLVLNVTGNVVAVPEPAGLLLLTAIPAFLLRRRRIKNG